MNSYSTLSQHSSSSRPESNNSRPAPPALRSNNGITRYNPPLPNGVRNNQPLQDPASRDAVLQPLPVLRSTLFSPAETAVVNGPVSAPSLSLAASPSGQPATHVNHLLRGTEAQRGLHGGSANEDEKLVPLAESNASVVTRDIIKPSNISPPQLSKHIHFRITPDIAMRITNLCCNYNFRCHIDLLRLAELGKNVVHKRHKSMVEMRLKSPPLVANISSSGKVVCFGWACNEYQLIRGARRVARHVQRIDSRVKFGNFRVNNTGAVAVLPYQLDLHRFASDARFRRDVIYEPEIYPGAEYRPDACVGFVKVFQTGSVKLIAPLVSDCIVLLRHFIPVAELFRAKLSHQQPHNSSYGQQQQARSPYGNALNIGSSKLHAVGKSGPSRIISSVVLPNGAPISSIACPKSTSSSLKIISSVSGVTSAANKSNSVSSTPRSADAGKNHQVTNNEKLIKNTGSRSDSEEVPDEVVQQFLVDEKNNIVDAGDDTDHVGDLDAVEHDDDEELVLHGPNAVF